MHTCKCNCHKENITILSFSAFFFPSLCLTSTDRLTENRLLLMTLSHAASLPHKVTVTWSIFISSHHISLTFTSLCKFALIATSSITWTFFFHYFLMNYTRHVSFCVSPRQHTVNYLLSCVSCISCYSSTFIRHFDSFIVLSSTLQQKQLQEIVTCSEQIIIKVFQACHCTWTVSHTCHFIFIFGNRLTLSFSFSLVFTFLFFLVSSRLFSFIWTWYHQFHCTIDLALFRHEGHFSFSSCYRKSTWSLLRWLTRSKMFSSSLSSFFLSLLSFASLVRSATDLSSCHRLPSDTFFFFSLLHVQWLTITRSLTLHINDSLTMTRFTFIFLFHRNSSPMAVCLLNHPVWWLHLHSARCVPCACERSLVTFVLFIYNWIYLDNEGERTSIREKSICSMHKSVRNWSARSSTWLLCTWWITLCVSVWNAPR